MNIWHDIDEERIYPTDFMAVVNLHGQQYEV